MRARVLPELERIFAYRERQLLADLAEAGAPERLVAEVLKAL